MSFYTQKCLKIEFSNFLNAFNAARCATPKTKAAFFIPKWPKTDQNLVFSTRHVTLILQKKTKALAPLGHSKHTFHTKKITQFPLKTDENGGWRSQFRTKLAHPFQYFDVWWSYQKRGSQGGKYINSKYRVENRDIPIPNNYFPGDNPTTSLPWYSMSRTFKIL